MSHMFCAIITEMSPMGAISVLRDFFSLAFVLISACTALWEDIMPIGKAVWVPSQLDVRTVTLKCIGHWALRFLLEIYLHLMAKSLISTPEQGDKVE